MSARILHAALDAAARLILKGAPSYWSIPEGSRASFLTGLPTKTAESGRLNANALTAAKTSTGIPMKELHMRNLTYAMQRCNREADDLQWKGHREAPASAFSQPRKPGSFSVPAGRMPGCVRQRTPPLRRRLPIPRTRSSPRANPGTLQLGCSPALSMPEPQRAQCTCEQGRQGRSPKKAINLMQEVCNYGQNICTTGLPSATIPLGACHGRSKVSTD